MTSRQELLRDWPSNGADKAAAERLVRQGLPALTPVLPDIVSWLRSNGPVRDVFGRFLADNGPAALEPVRLAFQGAHEEQVHFFLTQVLPGWRDSEIIALQPELEQWLQRPSLRGVNVFALALLHRSGASLHTPVREWSDLFRERLSAQLEALDRLDPAASDLTPP